MEMDNYSLALKTVQIQPLKHYTVSGSKPLAAMLLAMRISLHWHAFNLQKQIN